MKSFTDSGGRQWALAVNVDSIKRVRALLEVDLMTIIEGKLIDKLLSDPVMVVDIVYALCKPAADAAGVNDEQFGQAMAGDAIDNATAALLEDLTDFFPKGRRSPLKAAIAKVQQADSLALTRAAGKIQAINLESLMQPVAGSSSTNSLELSESTPDPSRSES